MSKKPIPSDRRWQWSAKHPAHDQCFDSFLRQMIPPMWPWRRALRERIIIDTRRKPTSPIDSTVRRARQIAKRARQSKERR